MRPGHCAPERERGRATLQGRAGRFNEAGALCPGKSRPPDLPRRSPAPRFNEAGALCPGKRSDDRHHHDEPQLASMRPGHCAPERVRESGESGSRASPLQ